MHKEVINETAQDDQEYQRQLSEKLQVFGSKLARMASEQVTQRYNIEQRWLHDLRQYHGKYEPEEKAHLEKVEHQSKIFVNITRNKTNAAEARLSDMLFPTDDRNWGIRPTPVPELSTIAKEQGLQGDQARILIQQAKEAAESMTKEIEDQLIESSYAARCRDMIHDACVLGTGVIKGPVIVGRTRQSWNTDQTGVSVLDIVEDFSPETRYVSPWNFFPDMSASTMEDREFTFERHYLTKKRLIDLAKSPGYLIDQLRMVLKEDPRNSQFSSNNWQNDLRDINGVDNTDENNRYEMWEYNGPISEDELLAAGVEIEEDDLNEYYGTVLLIGSHVVKVVIHPMDTQDDLYRVFNWEKDESSIFGFGVPYLMRNPQKVINASWRMMLDNGGLSTGPQVVVDRDAIEPADGDWSIVPRKIWFKKKSGVPVSAAFEVHHIQNNQSELMNIFTVARQLADEETNLPLIAQGEQSGHITKTAQGMDMLMNSANIVLRRAVKNFDDDVTRPHITSYYNWNMQFNDNPRIKGDFNIDARGSGALLAREMQQQRLLQFVQVAGMSQEFAMRTDWEGLYKQIVKHMQIAKDDVVLPPEKVQEIQQRMQAQGQQQIDPIKQAELQLKSQEAQFNQQYKQQTMALDYQFRERELVQREQIELARIASHEQITIAQLKERTGLEMHKEQNKRDIEAGRQTLEQSKQVLQSQNLQQRHDTF